MDAHADPWWRHTTATSARFELSAEKLTRLQTQLRRVRRPSLSLHHCRESPGDLRVAVLCGVLISHGGPYGRVSKSVHQFGQRGARGGSENRPGVPEVVPAEVGTASSVPGRVEPAVEGARGQLF